jgi:hypothetical protein
MHGTTGPRLLLLLLLLLMTLLPLLHVVMGEREMTWKGTVRRRVRCVARAQVVLEVDLLLQLWQPVLKMGYGVMLGELAVLVMQAILAPGVGCGTEGSAAENRRDAG